MIDAVRPMTVHGALGSGHTFTFACRCGSLITVPSFGYARTTHECGRTWWWADTDVLNCDEEE